MTERAKEREKDGQRERERERFNKDNIRRRIMDTLKEETKDNCIFRGVFAMQYI